MPRAARCEARARWVSALCAFGVAFPALADPPTAPGAGRTPTYDVYVTSSRDRVQDVATVRRLDREDIEWEDARTLDEALVHLPNVAVRRGGDGVPRIDVRGLRSRQLTLLVDGIPFNSTADGQFDASLVPTQLIERIDLVTSNSSVLYGDGGIAGVLQIQTRRPTPAPEVSAAFDARQGDQFQPEASISGTIGGFEAFVSGSYLDARGYELPRSFDETAVEDGGLRENADRRQGNVFGKLGYAISPGARVDLLVDVRDAEFGVPPNTVDDPADRFAPTTRYERVTRLAGFSTQLSGQLDPAGPLSLRGWGFANRQVEDRRRYDDASYDTISQSGTFSLDETTLTSGGSLHGRYDLGPLGELRAAANGRYEQFGAQGLRCIISKGSSASSCGPAGSATPFTRIDSDDDVGVWSLAVEYEVEPVEALGLVIGYGHAFLTGSSGVDADGSLVLAGATYDLPTKTRLRASVAHKIRFPSIVQLYDAVDGNPDLESERCWCFEVGVLQALPYAARVEVNAFQQELADFIERGASRVFENRQQIRIQGVELAWAVRPVEALDLRFAYAFLRSEDRSRDADFPRLANRPRHTIDFEGRFRHPWNGELRIALRHLRGMEQDSRNAPYELRTLDAFTTVDARVAQRFFGDRVELYAGVDNLFDAEGEINLGFPMAGRTVLGGGVVRF